MHHVFILRIGSEVFWTINARESRMNLWSQGRPKGKTYFYGGGPTAAICETPYKHFFEKCILRGKSFKFQDVKAL